MELQLKTLSDHDGEEIYNMLQEIETNDHGFHNEVRGMPFREFKSWLSINKGFSQGKGLEDWQVPQTTYWLYRDQTPVGCGRIRHWLTDNLKNGGGHIGYAIPVSERGKGYGNKLLQALLTECQKLAINPVQISANTDNICSNKVIKRNGGKLFKTTGDKNIYLIEI